MSKGARTITAKEKDKILRCINGSTSVLLHDLTGTIFAIVDKCDLPDKAYRLKLAMVLQYASIQLMQKEQS